MSYLKVERVSCEKNKKSPANAKGNARQRCMCEGLGRIKSKFTTMFHLDSTRAPCLVHEFQYYVPRPMHEFQHWLKIAKKSIQ